MLFKTFFPLLSKMKNLGIFSCRDNFVYRQFIRLLISSWMPRPPQLNKTKWSYFSAFPARNHFPGRVENFHKNSNLFKLLNFLLGSNFHPRRERDEKTKPDTENSSGKINKRLHNLLLVGSLRRFLLRLKETQKICCKKNKIFKLIPLAFVPYLETFRCY